MAAEVFPRPEDTAALRQAVTAFQTHRSMETFLEVLEAFQLRDPRDYEHDEFKTNIWPEIRTMSSLHASEAGSGAHALSVLLELVEESDDHHQYLTSAVPRYDLVRDVLEASQQVVGPTHAITCKLWLQLVLIARCPTGILDEILEDDGVMSTLATFFATGVPSPTTGTYMDSNLDEDPVREVRYWYALGLLFRRAGEGTAAKNAFHWGVTLGRDARVHELYLLRRGPMAQIDLDFIVGRLLREMADMAEQDDQDADALHYLVGMIEMERGGMLRNGYPPGYAGFLEEVCVPDFGGERLRRAMSCQLSLVPAQFLGGVSTLLRVRAGMLHRYGRSADALSLLDAGVDYFRRRLATLSGEGVMEAGFEENVTTAFYLVVRKRFTLRERDAGDDPTLQLEAHVEFLRDVYVDDLEDDGEEDRVCVIRCMTRQVRAGIADREFFASTRRASHAIRLYLPHPWVPVDEGDAALAAAVELREALADYAFRVGELASFMSELTLRPASEVLAGRVQNPTDDLRFARVRRHLDALLRRQGETGARTADGLEQAFTIMDALLASGSPSGSEPSNRVPRLAVLARGGISHSHLREVLEGLLRQDCVILSLRDVTAALEAPPYRYVFSAMS